MSLEVVSFTQIRVSTENRQRWRFFGLRKEKANTSNIGRINIFSYITELVTHVW